VFTARYELSLQIQLRLILDLNAWLLAGRVCASRRSCDRGCLWFSLVLEHMLSWYPEIHVHDSHPVLAKMQPSKRDKNFVSVLPFKHKMQPKRPVPFLCCILPTVHFPPSYLLHYWTLFFLPYCQPICSKRTSRRCLGACRTINVSECHPVVTTYAVLLSAPPSRFLLFLTTFFHDSSYSSNC